MFFDSNSLISITTITREYKIFDRDIDAWVAEGWFPAYVWKNGHRYWDSNKFNEFAAGSPLRLPVYQVKQDSNNAPDYFTIFVALGAVLLLTNAL
jgi:hypothetical protein